MMTRPLPVIVNRSGGAARAAGDALGARIEAAFAAADTPIALELVEGEAIAATIAAAVKANPRVVVAGGDGTIATAASLAVDAGAELAILPLGTLNHLARDLGLPTALEAAAALAVNGAARRIDVARVNDRRFVNNASIGLYSLMVRHREVGQERHGLPKWLAAVPAAGHALGRLPHHRLRLRFDGEAHRIATPLLFVGNNDYSLDAGALGTRAALDDGKLSILAVTRRSRLGLVWFALRALAGRADLDQDFCALGNCATLIVEGHGDDVEIALDGEVTRLALPLRFAIERGALAVVAPAVDVAK